MENLFRDTYIVINDDNVLHNLNYLKKTCSPKKFLFAVIKGNGYGHGLMDMALLVQHSKCDGIAVATGDEAIVARQYAEKKILNLGVTRLEDYAEMANSDITVTVASMSHAQFLSQLPLHNKLKVHLKVNSGMNRIGFNNLREINKAIDLIKQNKMINIEGIFTHFATAEDYHLEDYMHEQIKMFKHIVEKANHSFKMIHCTNSASLLKLHDKLDFTTANRAGIAIYGALQDKIKDQYDLRLTWQLVSTIVQVNNHQVGTKIGYSNRYTTKHENEYIATLPIGYADGLHRKLTGAMVVTENDIVGRICGSICMDQMMVSFDQEVEEGLEVYIISEDDENNVYTTAQYLETITHEIFTSISHRVPRFHVYNDQTEMLFNDLLYLGSQINYIQMRRQIQELSEIIEEMDPDFIDDEDEVLIS